MNKRPPVLATLRKTKRLYILLALALCFSIYTLSYRTVQDDEFIIRQHFVKLQTSKPKPKPQIPKIIHQVYANSSIPEQWRTPFQSCRDKHPDWQHMLWTDSVALQFLKEYYSWFVPIYESYPYMIQRVDAIRYFVLYHYGGVYLDLDIGCAKRLDDFRPFSAVLAKTYPIGVSNDFMATTAHHPFFDQVLHALKSHAHTFGTKLPTVMFSTGPMFVNFELARYLRRTRVHHCSNKNAVCVVEQRWYENTPGSYFQHYEGSSWHGWDSHVLSYCGEKKLFVFGGLLSVACIAIVSRRRFRR